MGWVGDVSPAGFAVRLMCRDITGDSHSSPGMLQFASLITDIHPGIFIHSIYMDEDLDKDRKAGFVRNVVIPDSYTQLKSSCQIVRKR
jgi:hypothetical protein